MKSLRRLEIEKHCRCTEAGIKKSIFKKLLPKCQLIH